MCAIPSLYSCLLFVLVKQLLSRTYSLIFLSILASCAHWNSSPVSNIWIREAPSLGHSHLCSFVAKELFTDWHFCLHCISCSPLQNLQKSTFDNDTGKFTIYFIKCLTIWSQKKFLMDIDDIGSFMALASSSCWFLCVFFCSVDPYERTLINK